MGWKCSHCGDNGPGTNAIACPACGAETPTPTDDHGFTASDWLARGTRRGRAMYERARKRIRFIAVDPEETLVFRGDDLIGPVWPVDPHGGGGMDLRIDPDRLRPRRPGAGPPPRRCDRRRQPALRRTAARPGRASERAFSFSPVRAGESLERAIAP